MTKVLRAHAVIWVDEVQYSHYSFTARNRLPNNTMMVLPLKSDTRHGLIKDVELVATTAWRAKLSRTLEYHYKSIATPYVEEILRPYGKLVGLNAALLRQLCQDIESTTEWHWQSQLKGGQKLDNIYDDLQITSLRKQISTQLAMMTQELGGDVYLSGPSAWAKKGGYLWEQPFIERNIKIQYWYYDGPNFNSLELVKKFFAI